MNSDASTPASSGSIWQSSSFQTAISQNEKFPEAHHELGLALYRNGKLPDSVASFRAAIQQRGGDFARAHHNLGLALADLNVLDEATKEFRLAIEQQPVFPRAFRNLGRTLYRLSDLDGSIAALRTAVDQRDGEFPEAYHDLGLAYFSKGSTR